MSYPTSVIERYDASVDDEYERSILHRSSTVAVRVSYLSALLLMAVLAWVLPGAHSLWAIALFLPLGFGEFISRRWMSRQVARPRPVSPSPFETTLLLAMTAIALVGTGHNREMLTPGFVSGGLIGIIFGAVLAIVLTSRRARRQRATDRARLESELED